MPCHDMVDAINRKFETVTIDEIFDFGLHEFITDFLCDSQALGRQIEVDYRFTE